MNIITFLFVRFVIVNCFFVFLCTYIYLFSYNLFVNIIRSFRHYDVNKLFYPQLLFRLFLLSCVAVFLFVVVTCLYFLRLTNSYISIFPLVAV